MPSAFLASKVQDWVKCDSLAGLQCDGHLGLGTPSKITNGSKWHKPQKAEFKVSRLT